MTDFLKGIDADERSMEKIAFALDRIATIMEKRFEKEFPVKVPRDAIVTKIPSDEDRLREDLGSTGEPLDEWIGLREQEVIKKEK